MVLKKIYLISLLLLSGWAAQAQQAVFRSPFDFPLLLSANFGELRPNHFHNGLDIKTEGTVGKNVRSVADGYVSRILVLHGGYGQALFVTHPNGYTSVYGHVMDFSPKIKKALREYQYRNETFVCDVRFDKNQIPVKVGEVIALSGNEGSSAGPHLHLELRRNDNGDYVDPMPFFKRYIKDTKAPTASFVALYPMPGKGVVDGSSTAKRIVPVASLGQHKFTAWGTVYAAISARDYMDGTSNFYGVHSVKLFVDSAEVFRCITDEVSADENRMINGLVDYDEMMTTRRLLVRSYRLPGNTLRLLHTHADSGLVQINEERDYRFRYVLEDDFGNTRVYSFVVTGRKQPVPPARQTRRTVLPWNRTNIVQQPGLEMVIPQGMLYDTAELDTQVRSDSGRISYTYVLDAGKTPLHGGCKLSIGLRNTPVQDTSKYYIAQHVGKRKSSVGGTCTDGWITTSVRSFGTFSVEIDTVPPHITPVGQSTWRTNRNIRFRIGDDQTGVRTYKVYVDGRFVLFGLKRGVLVVQDPERIQKGVAHTVSVTVTDHCGNTTRKQYKM